MVHKEKRRDYTHVGRVTADRRDVMLHRSCGSPFGPLTLGGLEERRTSRLLPPHNKDGRLTALDGL